MPDKKPIGMRRQAGAAATRRRAVVLATTVGALALVIAIGALIAGTFPRPDISATPSPSKPAVTAAAVSKTVASGTSVTASTAPAVAPPTAKPAPPAAKKPVTKKKTAAKKKAKKAAPVVPPLGMARVLPGSKQLIVATGAKLVTHGTVRIFNLTGSGWKQVLSAPARFGTYGLVDGTKRKQGSRMTPTGIWWPGTWVWGWHKSAPAGTRMPYRQTTQNVWWSDENNSTYNTWVVSSHRINGEHLVDVRIQYEYALSSGYNAPPNKVVRGRGTAIFLHVFDPPDYHNGLSAGCIGISRANMVKVFKTMDPALKPCFASGTESSGAGSIASY